MSLRIRVSDQQNNGPFPIMPAVTDEIMYHQEDPETGPDELMVRPRRKSHPFRYIGISLAVLGLVGLMLSLRSNLTNDIQQQVMESEQNPVSTIPPTDTDFCVSKDDRVKIKDLCHRNNSIICVVFVEEPTYVELVSQGNVSSTSSMHIFPCNDHIAHGFDGVVFDILQHNEAWEKMTCIYCKGCTFNEVAELTADKSETNPHGIGADTSLIYVGFLLWTLYRQGLDLEFSKSFYREMVVLVGIDPGDIYDQSVLQPMALVARVVDPVVFIILSCLLSSYTLVAFVLGGNENTRSWRRHGEPCWTLAWSRYNTTFFSPAQAEGALGEPQDMERRRLQCLRFFHFVFVLCCSGGFVFFEGALLFSPRPPPLQTGQPLEALIRDGKVYVVKNSAVQDTMQRSFSPDLANNFRTCESTRACARIVAKNEGSYHLTLESLVFSEVIDDAMAVYHTDQDLNMFEGGFFFSSGLPKSEKYQMEAVLYNVTLKEHGEWLEKTIRGHQIARKDFANSNDSNEALFTWRHLLFGMGVPLAAYGLMHALLLGFCIAWALYSASFGLDLLGFAPK